jgi:hypothetical protein
MGGVLQGKTMTKIILLFWVLTANGNITEPQRFEGWSSMAECEVAAVSLTEENIQLKATHKYAVIARCIQVAQ